MDNLTKNILTGIRQWFHKKQDDAQVVLISHIEKLYSVVRDVQSKIAAIDSALAKINEVLLTTMYLTQEEYDAIKTKDEHVIYIISNPYWVSCYIGSYPVYSKIPDDALYFKAEGVDSTIAINITNGAEFEYSTDWYSWKPYTSGEVIPIPANFKVYFRGLSFCNNYSISGPIPVQFVMTGKISAHGDLLQLYKDKKLTKYNFIYLFNGCESLVRAPELTATTLTDYCYGWMFDNCYNLKYIKCLATPPSVSSGVVDSLTHWVNRVSATGTFVKRAGTLWSKSDSGIPEGWTVEEVEPESSNENAE